MSWQAPWKNVKVVRKSGGELSPFYFNGNRYAVENFFGANMFHPGKKVRQFYHEDGFMIRELDSDRILSIPLLNHYFASAYPHDGMVTVFSTDYGSDLGWWKAERIVSISSRDLITWSAPKEVLRVEPGEHVFNSSVTFDGKRYVMLYESDDKKWTPFSFKFAESTDLVNWTRIPVDKAVYGTDRYVGGPALYFRGGYYYLLYLEDRKGFYETRITRSLDLKNWEDAPLERPFLTPNKRHETNPEQFPFVRDINASDPELLEKDGITTVWWNGGNQAGCADLKSAEYDGTIQDLFEYFFL